MLAHLDEVIIEASPRFRVRVSGPGARRHFPRSGSSPPGSWPCVSRASGRVDASLSGLTVTLMSAGRRQIWCFGLYSSPPLWLRLLALHALHVMTSLRLRPRGSRKCREILVFSVSLNIYCWMLIPLLIIIDYFLLIYWFINYFIHLILLIGKNRKHNCPIKKLDLCTLFNI